MSELVEKSCTPCRAGTPKLEPAKIDEYLRALSGWTVVDGHHLSKTFGFPDFESALEWTNIIGAIAEKEKHHPDIRLSWGKVGVEIWTHKIGGLSENDFILAAKIDEALARFPVK